MLDFETLGGFLLGVIGSLISFVIGAVEYQTFNECFSLWGDSTSLSRTLDYLKDKEREEKISEEDPNDILTEEENH